MKLLNQSFASAVYSFRTMFLAVCLAGPGLRCAAQTYNLHQNNSTADIDVASGPGGMLNWYVDGVNQLYQSWFYYRVGSSGPEYPIENLDSTPTINSYVNIPGLSRLTVTYADANYSINTLYLLTGQAAGSGKSTINETITVTNASTSGTVTFHLFQYSDFDLGGVSGGQSAQYYTNSINGQYYKVIQTDGSRSVTETITTANPAIGHFEAGVFNSTLASLTDGNPTTLSDTTVAGVGDVTFAYEWDVVLAPGGSFQISKILAIVPEPSSAALMLLGMAGLRLMRRGRPAASATGSSGN